MRSHSAVRNISGRLTKVLFIVYLLILGWVLLLKSGVQFSYMGERSVNLTPFGEVPVFNIQDALNILVFVPLGIYAGILVGRWSFGKKLLFFASLSFIIEVLQYVLRMGAFDVTDIITNTTGGLIGLILYKSIQRTLGDIGYVHNIINIVATVGTLLVIALLVLLKINMLPVRYQ